MKRFKKIVCEKCNRAIQKRDLSQRYERHLICPHCGDMLLQHTTVATFMKVRYALYGWLKIPSLLLAAIGLLGILMAHSEAVATQLSFLNMPPAGRCYLIVAGAMILLGISIIYRQSKEKVAFDRNVPLEIEERWRSM